MHWFGGKGSVAIICPHGTHYSAFRLHPARRPLPGGLCAELRHVGLCAVVSHCVCRDGCGGDAVFAGRLPAVCGGCHVWCCSYVFSHRRRRVAGCHHVGR